MLGDYPRCSLGVGLESQDLSIRAQARGGRAAEDRGFEKGCLSHKPGLEEVGGSRGSNSQLASWQPSLFNSNFLAAHLPLLEVVVLVSRQRMLLEHA